MFIHDISLLCLSHNIIVIHIIILYFTAPRSFMVGYKNCDIITDPVLTRFKNYNKLLWCDIIKYYCLFTWPVALLLTRSLYRDECSLDI